MTTLPKVYIIKLIWKTPDYDHADEREERIRRRKRGSEGEREHDKVVRREREKTKFVRRSLMG